MATVRDREALLHLIVDQVQPLFGFNEHANLCTLTEDGARLRMFFTKVDPAAQQASAIPHFQEFPVEGTFVYILDQEEVVIHDESWKTSPKDNPTDEAAAQIWRDLDFKYSLSVALRYAGHVIGGFHVHFYHVPAFQAGDLLAGTVANILANEEIVQR